MVLLKRNLFTLPSMIDLAAEIDAILFVDHVESQKFPLGQSVSPESLRFGEANLYIFPCVF